MCDSGINYATKSLFNIDRPDNSNSVTPTPPTSNQPPTTSKSIHTASPVVNLCTPFLIIIVVTSSVTGATERPESQISGYIYVGAGVGGGVLIVVIFIIIILMCMCWKKSQKDKRGYY